jgi:hypothetical protein
MITSSAKDASVRACTTIARDSSPGPVASEMRWHCTFRRVRANAKFNLVGSAPTMSKGKLGIITS